MAAFENHVNLDSVEQFSEFQSDGMKSKTQDDILKTIFAP